MPNNQAVLWADVMRLIGKQHPNTKTQQLCEQWAEILEDAMLVIKPANEA